MTKLMQNFGEVIWGPEKNYSPNGEFITIGDQVFAVAHSREEMTRMMRMGNKKVTGYVFQHSI